MEQAKCPKAECNGVLVPGVRGFQKCTVCGAKIKNSLVNIPQTTQTPIEIPIVENKTPELINTVQPVSAEPTTVTKKPKAASINKTLIIQCCDCGVEREIKVQDAFQVKRCKECQKKFTSKRRSERTKAKRQAIKIEQA